LTPTRCALCARPVAAASRPVSRRASQCGGRRHAPVWRRRGGIVGRQAGFSFAAASGLSALLSCSLPGLRCSCSHLCKQSADSYSRQLSTPSSQCPTPTTSLHRLPSRKSRPMPPSPAPSPRLLPLPAVAASAAAAAQPPRPPPSLAAAPSRRGPSSRARAGAMRMLR
jgi:hypothetical protein